MVYKRAKLSILKDKRDKWLVVCYWISKTLHGYRMPLATKSMDFLIFQNPYYGYLMAVW